MTYRLRPVPDALVYFTPTDGRRNAMGRTDAQGRFSLTTFERNDGAVVGSHRVHVVVFGPGREMTPDEKAKNPGDSYYIPGSPLVPARYLQADTSGLTAEVTPEGPNDFRFDLVD